MIENEEKMNEEETYICDSCSLAEKCHCERLCMMCLKLKPPGEWCLKKSEILCLPCFEEHNYKPLWLIKRDLKVKSGLVKEKWFPCDQNE